MSTKDCTTCKFFVLKYASPMLLDCVRYPQIVTKKVSICGEYSAGSPIYLVEGGQSVIHLLYLALDRAGRLLVGQ